MLISLNYLKNKYKIQSAGVLHIGASEGQEAKEYHSLGMKKMIFIEAIPDIYMKLKENISKYEGTIAINACISDEDDKVVGFNIANNDGQSSSFLDFGTHSSEHPSVKFIDRIKMVTKRVDTIVKEQNIDLSEVNFLNIDLQGAELFALKGMGELLNNFKYAYLEVNTAELYKGCAKVEEIDEYLAKFGFVGVEVIMTDHHWGDKFYIKSNKAE